MADRHVQSEGKKLVSYVSDLEGNYDYWNRYIEMSEVLQRLPDGKVALQNPLYHFVHGGDVCDRSKGDIRILKELVELKRTYPDNIHFLLGNRDVNKLRLPVAMHSTVLKFRPHAYWVNDATIEENFPLNDRIARMKWILKGTMGAPFAFECHRQELQEIGLPHTDEDVVESFLELIHEETGDLFEYLSYGKMSVIIDDTIYVHGGLTKFGLGFVPPKYSYQDNQFSEFTMDKNLSPKQWTYWINQFATHEVSEYKRHIRNYLQRLTTLVTENPHLSFEEFSSHLWDSVGGYRHPQPGSRLIQCGMGMLPRDKEAKETTGSLPSNPSIIYNGYLANGKPVHLDPDVATWLKRDGISKIVVGHQPNGDTPFTIDELEIQAISADISYSKFVMWPQEDLIHAAKMLEMDLSKLNRLPDEFLDFQKFKTTVLGYPPLPSNPPASIQADTRNELAINELLQVVDLTPVKLSASQQHLPVGCSVIRMHGTTGCGATYSFELPPSYQNTVIGKRLADDWWVKAINVRFPTCISEEYYLLSYSEGFTFKNKLVRAVDFQQRMEEEEKI